MDKFWQAINAKGLDDNPALQIYQTNFLAARLKALEYNFSLCKALLGDSLFTAIAKHYAHSFPSESDSLNAYGKHFPAFLNEIMPHNPRLQNTGYIAQLAEFDWLLIQAYFAEDDNLDNINTAEDAVTENTYIVSASSLGLCQINHSDLIMSDSFQTLIKQGIGESEHICANLRLESNNVVSSLRQPHDSISEESAEASALKKQNQSNTVYMAIVRQNLTVYIHLLTKEAFSLLQLIRERTPIFNLDELGLDPQMFSATLNTFKQKGLIMGLKEGQQQAKRDDIDDTLQ